MSSPLHPSVNVCAMCGALVGDELKHRAFHMVTDASATACLSALNQMTDSLGQLSEAIVNDHNLLTAFINEVSRIDELQRADDERLQDLEFLQLDLEDR